MKKVLSILVPLFAVLAIWAYTQSGTSQDDMSYGRGLDDQSDIDETSTDEFGSSESSAVVANSEVDAPNSSQIEGDVGWQINLGDSQISVRPFPAPPDYPVIDILEKKWDLALSGKSDDALYIHYALEFCRNSPRSAEQYENAHRQLLSTRKVKGVVYTDDTTADENLLANRHAVCDGVSDDNLSASREFLRIASDGGLPEAQVLYANVLLNSMNENTPLDELNVAFDLLTASRNAGNADAYYWRGSLGLKGNFGADRNSALADLLVAQAVYSKNGIRRNLGEVIETEFQQLYLREREEVISLAIERANSNSCCSYIYGESWEEVLRGKSN